MIATSKVASRAPFPAQTLFWVLLIALMAFMTAPAPTTVFAQEDEAETESAEDAADTEKAEESDEAEKSDEAEESDEAEKSDEAEEDEDAAAEADSKSAKTAAAAKQSTVRKTPKIVPKSTTARSAKSNPTEKKPLTARDRVAERKRKHREKLRLQNQAAGAKKRKVGKPKTVKPPVKKPVANTKKAEPDKKAEGFVAWFRANKWLALGGAWGGFIAIAGGITLVVLRRRKGVVKIAGAELTAEEFEGTEAKTEEIDVNDKSYALVVEEEDLELPPTPEEKLKSAELRRIQKVRTQHEEIERLIDRESFDRAFDRYREHLQSDETDEPLQSDRELTLGKHFLQEGDLDKASRIFEHFIDTQPESEIEPEVFFDLGYIHFKSNTLRKSRDYFERFAERETRPERVERARKLVQRLEKVQNLN